MKKIVIFGNSGSGKSTLARKLSVSHGLPHLDLDTLAWKPTAPPERAPLKQSTAQILEFVGSTHEWVVEGCYADLLAVAVPFASEMIFMNLPVEACITNAKNRPWEPHKYASKKAQDDNLEMLIDWISQYPKRKDTLSAAAHTKLYEQFSGQKSMVTSNG